MVAQLCQAINQARTKWTQESILYNLAFLLLQPEAAISYLWGAELTAPTSHTGLCLQLQAPGGQSASGGRNGPHGGSTAPGCSCLLSSCHSPVCHQRRQRDLSSEMQFPDHLSNLQTCSSGASPLVPTSNLEAPVPGYPSCTTFLF